MAVQAPADSFNDRGDLIPPGDYHAVVAAIDESGGKKGEMIVDFEIVAPPHAKGATHREYFHLTKEAMWRIHALAIALGLVTKDQLKKMKEARQTASYEFERDGVKKQCFLRAEEEEYEGKKRSKVGGGMYHPNDPFCVKFPRDQAWLDRGGYKPAGAATTTTPTPSPQQQPVIPGMPVNTSNDLPF